MQMLSNRGALNTSSLLMEVAVAQPKDSKRIFLLSEAEKVWTAMSKVIRYQLTQGNNVTVPKLGSFWFDQKHLVSDGPTKYYSRVPHFGFNALFGTTYGLDTTSVPRESTKVVYEKLAIDQIAEASNVPATTVLLVLSEVFLFVGEGLYVGKSFSLEFPFLTAILVKREKCLVTFDCGFTSDIYAIDSRKWPLAVKEVAAMSLRPATPQAAQPRPRSASSSRPLVGGAVKEMEPKPAFVAAATQGRLFSELVNRPVSAKPANQTKASQNLKAKHKPLLASPRHAQVRDSSVVDEESVYDILSPSRQQPVTLDDLPPFEQPRRFVHRDDDDDFTELQPEIPAIVQQQHQQHQQQQLEAEQPTRPNGSSNIRDVLFGDNGSVDHRPKSGRRRFAAPPNQVSALFDR